MTTSINKKFRINILNMYVFLFIFTMFNREILPLGIDVRYIQIILGILLIAKKMLLILKCRMVKTSKVKNITLCIYIYIIIVNLRWFYSGININSIEFTNMMILNISNLISILVFYSHANSINKDKIIKYTMISCIVLFVSMILVLNGLSLNEIMGGDYSGVYAGGEHFNFFGQNKRIAGYAQDPNYASIFMILTFLMVVYYCNERIKKVSMILITIMGYMLSASKTILIGVIISVCFVYVIKKIRNNKISNLIESLFVIIICFGPYVIIKLMNIINAGFNMQTMGTRLSMWTVAMDLFEKNPIVGCGITSFRSVFSTTNNGWYVQAHSTIFQILSEMGIVGMVLFTILFIRIIKNRNKYIKINIILFLIFSLTSELIYLSIFPFIISLLPIVFSKEISENKEYIYEGKSKKSCIYS